MKILMVCCMITLSILVIFVSIKNEQLSAEIRASEHNHLLNFGSHEVLEQEYTVERSEWHIALAQCSDKKMYIERYNCRATIVKMMPAMPKELDPMLDASLEDFHYASEIQLRDYMTFGKGHENDGRDRLYRN